MNVFILNSGRCGSTTFIKACAHIHNYSAGHESRLQLIGKARLAYPEQHIEADNRLCWMLGRLHQAYGDRAFYVHLTRDRQATAASFLKRTQLHTGIIKAYREGILRHPHPQAPDAAIVEDYLDTLEANIALFLQDKTQSMHFRLEHANDDFHEFWHRIQASGDRQAALAQWQTRYNASSD